jgi:Autographiviridae endonuclease VII
MSLSESRRKRYAEDPQFRAKVRASRQAYRERHREQIRARAREKLSSDPEFRERERARRIVAWRRSAYGLSLEDYERMVTEQNGLCLICRRKARRGLCVDHCHATRKVRGLLCDKCNTALGLLDDDADRLRKAGAYVDRGGRRPDIVIRGARSERRHGPRIRATLYLRAEVGLFQLG